MVDVEITKEEAALILHDFNTALKDLNQLLKDEATHLAEMPGVGDAFGSGVDGKAQLDVVKKSGGTFKQYVQDTIDKVTELRDKAKARFDALFGTDFDSAIDISKLDPNLGNQGHLTGF
ncbi:hypothetical protein Srot_0907 [Segniliparus rotundus DSM 44985]|uniref:WXG100 family type VII secretion target n=1 Tax=Segniliparus rotundus (strain ATCC BAA-972 / CDC 1076 / CIP 108378 / DSM 44985 / JCM 13578) TaxID=640132 RepID=D6ZEA4_SEGRD|nr:hypothetical protein [Segniliparus rotundus]ADG97384.1 hypothetical protein Srot_0907 [Segniliparus rotundus DSM 44985]